MMANPQAIPQAGEDPFYADLAKVGAAKTPQEMDIARAKAMQAGLTTPPTAPAPGQQPPQPSAGDEFDQALLEAQQSGERSRQLIHQAYAGSEAITPTGQAVTAPGAAPTVDKDAKYDASDKKSMLGHLLLGGHMGLYEMAARLEQLRLKAAERKQDVGLFPITDQLKKVLPKGTAEAFTKEFNRRYLKDPQYLAALKKAPVATRIGEFAGGTVPLLSIPFGAAERGVVSGVEALAPSLAKLSPLAGRALLRTAPTLGRYLTGAAIGTSQYDPTGKQGYLQATLGGLTGAILPPALRRFAASGVGTITPEMEQAAQKLGIELPGAPGVERMLARVPLGGMKKLIEERGRKLAEGVRQFGQQVVGEAPPPEGSYEQDFTGGIKKELEANRIRQTVMRNKIEDITEKKGITQNPLNLKVAASNAKLELQNVQSQFRTKANEDLINDMDNYINSPNQRYIEMDALKKQIGGQIEVAKNKESGIPAHIRSIYKSLYGAVKQDMNDLADKVGGNVKKLHYQADQDYQNKILPLTKAPFNKFIRGDLTSKEFIGKFLNPDAEKNIDQLTQHLPAGDAKSKLSARAALINHSLEESDLPGAGFNGKKFADKLVKIDKSTGNLLSPEQKQTIKGYQALGNYLEKVAPQSTNLAKIKKSGMPASLLHMGGLGMAFFHPYILGSIYFSGLGASRLLTTKAGQSLMRTVARGGGTRLAEKMNPLMRQAAKIMLTKYGAQEGTKWLGSE